MKPTTKEKRAETLKRAMEMARGRLLFAAAVALITRDIDTLKKRQAEFMQAQNDYIDALVGKRKRGKAKLWPNGAIE